MNRVGNFREKQSLTIARQIQKSSSRKSMIEQGGEQGFMNRLANTLLKDPRDRTVAEIDFLFYLTMHHPAGAAKDNYFQCFVKDNGESKLKDLLRYSYYEYIRVTKIYP